MLLSGRGCKWGPNPLGSIEQTLEDTSGEGVSSVSRAGGTPGWLLNLRSGTWDWQAYLDHFPRAQTSGPLAPAYPWTRTNDSSLPMLAPPTTYASYCTHSGPQHADLSSFHAGNGLPHCGRAASRNRTRTTTNHGTRTSTGRVVELDSSHFGIRLIPKQAKASTSSCPTGRADSPARGVPRKLAGRSPGAASRHPSGTLLCLHVTKTGSDGQELTPLLPLDATRSSTCRRLGYIVTKGPARTRDPPSVHQQPTAGSNRARIRPNPLLASCGTDPPPGRTVAPWEPSNRDQPRAAFPSHPTSRPAAATHRPGLGSDRTKLQVLGRPQIWPTSTSAKSGQSRHPLIVTSRFISITRRRFHHDNHSSVLTSARPATFLVHSRFQASLQDTRKIPRIDYLLQLLGCARLLDISLKTALKNYIHPIYSGRNFSH